MSVTAVVTTVVLGTLVAWPALASAKGGGHAYGYGYGYGYGDNVRPGWGYGDKNHVHTGPPGQVGKDHGKKSDSHEDDDKHGDDHGQG